MAHIFKFPTNNSNGIIVFTHKEVFRKHLYPLNFLDDDFDRYFVGCHLGGHMRGLRMPDRIDFCMGKKTIARFKNENDFLRIPINSSGFTESFFAPSDCEKEYDIISIKNHIPSKNIIEMMYSISQLYNKYKKKYKILLISRKGDENYYNKMMNIYYSIFSEKQRELFTIIGKGPQLSRVEILNYLHKSKIFLFMSSTEGGAKCIAEALCAGLPVVYYKKMIGGGIENLNNKNSHPFSKLVGSELRIIQAVKKYNWNKFDLNQEDIRSNYSEKESLKKLNFYFSELFKSKNQIYDGNLINTDNLNFRLPAHYQDVPWHNPDFFTNDLRSKEQWEVFKENAKV